MATLLLGGCATAPAPKVPTAAPITQGASAPPSQVPQEQLTDFDKALRYTRCMTELGLPTADPVVGEALPIRMSFGRDVATDHYEEHAAKFRAAFNKCKPLLPATWPVKESPAQLAKERPFKECLRRHGIQTYEADENGMVHYPVDPSYSDTPEYQAAENACRHFYDDPANSGGS
jgi:hypothetical protein